MPARRRLAALSVALSPAPVVATSTRPPAPDGSPRTGPPNDGELSFQRGLAAFASKEAGWYDIVEKNGITLIYKAVEYSEFEEKIGDLDRSESRPGAPAYLPPADRPCLTVPCHGDSSLSIQ